MLALFFLFSSILLGTLLHFINTWENKSHFTPPIVPYESLKKKNMIKTVKTAISSVARIRWFVFENAVETKKNS